MSDPGAIFTGHRHGGVETIQAQGWFTWLVRGGVAKSLTPLYVKESSSLAEAQERAFLYLRQNPDKARKWGSEGWSIHHMPAETGIALKWDGAHVNVVQEGA